MNINNSIKNSDEFSSIYTYKNNNLKETLKQHYKHICYGTNLTGLPVTAVIRLRNPPAQPRAKRTLPRQVIELSELDHLDRDRSDHVRPLRSHESP
jgi:hypothetical protein